MEINCGLLFLAGCYAKCPENAPYLDENTMKCVQLSECSCFYNDVIPAGGAVVDDCGRTWYALCYFEQFFDFAC